MLVGQAPGLDTVVTAVGSGGAMAGLVGQLGARRVLGVHAGAVSAPAVTVSRLTGRYCLPESLRLRTDQVGAGYGALTEPAGSALLFAARTEGLMLDPVHTGRAPAGLAAARADGTVRPGQRPVPLRSGGLPGFFGHAPAPAVAESGLTAEGRAAFRPSRDGTPPAAWPNSINTPAAMAGSSA
ncbi:hypothetical protein [Streptomyces sp. CNQ085]|uniref:hypothetical protein n=1 Tax=Streptomyces sp. CNQ085 TaxID=2886944 RepID=UPI001F50D116|nr:hypothetical protein [Streptomyces sp. CNQ085]MCI0382854.1 hypothetical protein [Streptomyces sp. CNQ085]